MEMRRFGQEEINEADEEMDSQEEQEEQAESVDGESRDYEEDFIRMRFGRRGTAVNEEQETDDQYEEEVDSLSLEVDEVLIVEVVVRISIFSRFTLIPSSKFRVAPLYHSIPFARLSQRS